MRFTLEESDLIQLIGQSLGYELNPEDVTINANPFEVQIRNANLVALAEGKKTKPATREEYPDDLPDEDEEEQAAESVLTMAEILSQNSALAGKPLKRPLGPLETEEPPPFDQAELDAYKR